MKHVLSRRIASVRQSLWWSSSQALSRCLIADAQTISVRIRNKSTASSAIENTKQANDEVVMTKQRRGLLYGATESHFAGMQGPY